MREDNIVAFRSVGKSGMKAVAEHLKSQGYRVAEELPISGRRENLQRPIDLLLHGIVEYVQYLNFAGTLTPGFNILTE